MTSTRPFLTRMRAVVITLLGFLLAGGLIGGLGEAEREASPTDNAPSGYDSTKVTELLPELPSGDGSAAVLLFTKDGGFSKSDVGALQKKYAALLMEAVKDAPEGAQPPEGSGQPEGQPKESGRPEGQPGLTLSEDGTAAIGVVPILEAEEVAAAKAVTTLREDAKADLPEGVESAVTGPAAIQADLADVFSGANTTLLMVTGGVVILLLLITYRSPLLWIVPFLTVALADRTAVVAATQVLHAFDVAWDASTTGILSVLVFGAGTDYALLLISRYRDELRVHENRFEAMGVAWRRTFEAVITSAGTVFLGLLAMLLSVVPSTRGLGLACVVGIAVAAGFVLGVLPAFLTIFGRGIFWPLVPKVGDQGLAEGHGFWRRIGDAVAKRPALYAVAATLLLGVMSLGLLQIKSGLSVEDQFLDTPESISASARLSESFPSGTSDPTIVLTRADAQEVVEPAQDSTGVANARVANEGDGLSRIDVVFDDGAGDTEAGDLVRDLRTTLSDFDDTWVGGTQAEAVDETDAAERDRWLIIPLVLLVIWITLMVLLRSIVAPAILVVTVIATNFAALGAAWWLYTGLFGFEAMDTGVPLFAFIFLSALGVDYNIFLVSRAAEESREHGTRVGMLRGLAATGGVITSAGVLLAAVFAALGVLPLVVLAQLGIVICLGVLLDTLLVRTVLVPAIALILGDRFWWPRKVSRSG